MDMLPVMQRLMADYLLFAITELFYLEQIVDKPTRVNNILDLVFCPHTVSNGCNILPTGISDHNIKNTVKKQRNFLILIGGARLHRTSQN